MPGKELVRRPSYPPVPVEQQRKRESEAIVPRAFRGARRNRHVTVPLTAPPALWIASGAAHAFHAAGPVASASVVGTAAMWWLSRRKWDRDAEVWYARLSCAAGCGWVSLASWLGPAGGSAEALAIALLAGGAGWGIPWWRHKRPRGQRRRQKMLARWDGWWQLHAAAWGLQGSRVIEAAESGVTTRLRIQLWAGRQSVDHVRSALKLIESGLDGMCDHGMVALDTVKGRPSQCELRIKRENPLREPVAWDPALAPRSVHEDAVLGMSETAQWVHGPLLISSFVIGTTGSGKTNDLLCLALQLAGCPDARAVVIDLKEGRSTRPMLETGAVDYVITSVDEARMYLRMAVAEKAARARNAYHGEGQLHATPEVPALFTIIDEANPLSSASGDQECIELLGLIAAQGRELALRLRVYTQYGSLEESVSTEQIRSNLGQRQCYRVEEARHGAFIIPEYGKLDASKLEEPGTFLLKLGKDARPEHVRSPLMSHREFRSLARGIVARNPRAPLALYCGPLVAIPGDEEAGIPDVTWQEWWDDRWGRLDPAFRASSPQYQEWADARPGEAEAPAAVTRPAPPQARRPTPAAQEAAAIIADEAERYEDAPEGPLPKGSPKLADVLAAQREAFCDALASAPPEGISARQLEEESGRASTWVYDKLGRLADAGTAVKVKHGLWRAAPGKDVHAALAAVEARDDQLRADAKARARRGRIHAA